MMGRPQGPPLQLPGSGRRGRYIVRTSDPAEQTVTGPTGPYRIGSIGVRFGVLPNRIRDFSIILAISTSRSFGGALVTQPRMSFPAANATWSTA